MTRGALGTVIVDPADTELIGLDWAPRLAAQGRAAADIVAWSVTAPPPLTVAHSVRDGAVTKAWVSGAAAGASYLVVFRLQLGHPAGAGDPITWERSLRVTGREQ